MNPAEFANIARAEKDFWWYRGMRSVLLFFRVRSLATTFVQLLRLWVRLVVVR